jgi:hypothetical protein
MKRTHNLRLLTGETLDFCRCFQPDSSDAALAQRVMLGFSLYSSRLRAVVLLEHASQFQ